MAGRYEEIVQEIEATQAALAHVRELAAKHADREECEYIPELADAIADYWKTRTAVFYVERDV